MKKIAFLLVSLLILSNSFAQKSKKETIYLKNGSLIRGQLVRVDDDKVAVRSGRNIWILNDSQIDTVGSKREFRTFEYVASRYFLKTTVGILAGSSNNAKPTPFSFDASFNYRFLPKVYAGAGFGVDLLEESYLPVFLNLEYHFRQTRFTPFASVKGGYMVPLDDGVRTQTYYDVMPWSSIRPPYYQESLDNKGGLMFSPSFGFVNQFTENLGLSFSFGYRFHQTTFKGDNHYKLEKNYNRLSIRLGIVFN